MEVRTYIRCENRRNSVIYFIRLNNHMPISWIYQAAADDWNDYLCLLYWFVFTPPKYNDSKKVPVMIEASIDQLGIPKGHFCTLGNQLLPCTPGLAWKAAVARIVGRNRIQLHTTPFTAPKTLISDIIGHGPPRYWSNCKHHFFYRSVLKSLSTRQNVRH